MNAEAFKARTKEFALRIIRLVQALPNNKVAAVIGGQLLKAGTSVGANYRAACRAKSNAHFISKMGDVEEECDDLPEREVDVYRLQIAQKNGQSAWLTPIWAER